MSEGPIKSNIHENSIGFKPHINQSEILSDFRLNCEQKAGKHPTGEERVELYQMLHKYLDNLDDANLINRYEQGTIPTIESINLSIEEARKALLLMHGDSDCIRIEKLLQGQRSVIRNWCKRYVNTIIIFHVKKNSWHLLNGTDQRDAFLAADSERRRVHNALLNSLSELNSLLIEASKNSDFTLPPQWSRSSNVVIGSTLHSPMIFSAQVIADRDYIKSWAIAANSLEEMKKILEVDELPPK